LDPGAVPGASTKADFIENQRRPKADLLNPRKGKAGLVKPALMGAKQDRQGCKGWFFARDGSDVSGYFIVANDNYAPVALAA